MSRESFLGLRPASLCALLVSAVGVASCPVPGEAQARRATATRAAEPRGAGGADGPWLAAYRWGAANPNGGAAANEVYARWLNRPVVWAEDFMPTDRWDASEGGEWQLGEWSAWKKALPARRLILSVPLLAGPWDLSGPKAGPHANEPVSLQAGARGDYDAHYRTLAQNLVRYGLSDTILRLGWEFNGGWYAWRAGVNPEAFAGYWREIVKTMRAVPGAEKLRFCWNPAVGYQQFPAEKAWPGDAWVDVVGLDVYDDAWLPDTYPLPAGASLDEIQMRRSRVWDKVVLNGDHGLQFWRDFAATHGKPFSIPEWGVDQRADGHGGLDDDAFVARMHDFIVDPANRIAFYCYFDVLAPDGGHQLSPGKSGAETTPFPNSAAKFKALFRGDAK